MIPAVDINGNDRTENRAPSLSKPSPTQPIILDSLRLFGGQREIQIRHQGEFYRLRLTKNGKLILNK